MTEREMLRILNDYLTGKTVTDAELETANEAFERFGGGARLLRLGKMLGERARDDQVPETVAPVLDLQEILIRRSENRLTVINGPAVERASGWMNASEGVIRLDLRLPDKPENHAELSIESTADNEFQIDLLTVDGPDRDRCTLTIESQGRVSRLDAALTRRIVVNSGRHELAVTFGDAGSVRVSIDLE